MCCITNTEGAWVLPSVCLQTSNNVIRLSIFVTPLPPTTSTFCRTICLTSCHLEAYCYKVLMDTYILKYIHYLFLKSSVHIAQHVILILLIFYVLRLFECFREKYDPGKCVIRTTLKHWVVTGTEISCCSLSFGWSHGVWILHRPRRWNRRFETSAHKIQTTGNRPQKKTTTFKTRWNFEINGNSYL